MTEKPQDMILAQTAALLGRYGFESKGYTPPELLRKWRQQYPVKWIRLAVIEALYQGRYKVISIEQILSLWLRRTQATYHFTHEFEHLICRNLSYEISVLGETFANDLADSSFQKSVSVRTVAKREQANTIIPNKSEESYSYQKESELEELQAEETENSHARMPKPVAQSHQPQDKLTDLKDIFAKFEGEIEDITALSQNYVASVLSQSLSSDYSSENQGIDEFIPLLDDSELYAKLKAVVHQEQLSANSQA